MKRCFGVLALSSLLFANGASAGEIWEVPTAWRLQNYMGNNISAYFTSAAGCTYGGLNFPASATADDKNRFWSAVMTARATNKTIGVFFSGSGSACVIDSFFLQN